MTTDEIELGDTVQDIYTGFKGIAVAKTEFINKCIQFSIVPKWEKTTPAEQMELSIDSQSLRIIKKLKKPKPEPKPKSTGGPSRRAFRQRGY